MRGRGGRSPCAQRDQRGGGRERSPGKSARGRGCSPSHWRPDRVSGPSAAAQGLGRREGRVPQVERGERGEARAAYVRRAAGGMKGAESGSRPARSPLLRSRVPAPARSAPQAFPGVAGGEDSRSRLPGRRARARAGRRGAGGGDVAAAQAGGAGPRREAEPPREEAPSGQGAAAGGSGNAGSGACPGERPARSVAGSAAGLARGPGSSGRERCPRGTGS